MLKVRRCRIRSSHGSCRLRLAVLQLTLALLSTACAASGKRCAGGQVGPAILSRDGRVPRVLGAPVQVLADNRSRRQRVWRPPPGHNAHRWHGAGRAQGCRGLGSCIVILACGVACSCLVRVSRPVPVVLYTSGPSSRPGRARRAYWDRAAGGTDQTCDPLLRPATVIAYSHLRASLLKKRFAPLATRSAQATYRARWRGASAKAASRPGVTAGHLVETSWSSTTRLCL